METLRTQSSLRYCSDAMSRAAFTRAIWRRGPGWIITTAFALMVARSVAYADVPAGTPPSNADFGVTPSPAQPTTEDPNQFVRVGVDDRITLHVASLPLADAMRMLSESTKRNIILGPGATGEISATLYDATFDEALHAMLVANGLGFRVEGNFIFVHPAEEIRAIEQASREIRTHIFKLSYARARDIKALIEPLKSKGGSIAVTPETKVGLGGESGPSDTEGDQSAAAEMVIVTDYVDVVERMARLIREVDQRPRQVLIESTILRATLNETNALGIDFTTVGGIDFTALSSVSPGVQDITTGLVPVQSLSETTLTARTDLNGAVPGGGFTFGIIKDQISLFIRALESVTDTNVIANPKVLALNKQFGQVIVGRRDGYITTTITETTATQTVEFLETGTILSFRPFIGDDGYVRMEIHPKDSTGGLTAENLPFEQTTEVTTNIVVRDGHTILIGGLFREVSTAARDQVPVAGDIPFLGPLFRATSDTTVREEVIVLLTVRIVKDPYDHQMGESLYQDTERMRMLSRQGVQPIGRERLSSQYFIKATEALDAGDVDRAAWYARLSLNHFPRNIHALKLLEQINGKRAWESEASSIRTAVRELIDQEKGIPPTPEFGRGGPPFELPDWLDVEPSSRRGEPLGSNAGSAPVYPNRAIPAPANRPLEKSDPTPRDARSESSTAAKHGTMREVSR